MREATAPRILIAPRRGGSVVKIEGVLDERFDGTSILSINGPIVFDLDGVWRITSSGVRRWLEMLRGLPPSPYCFVRCRPAIVAQFNLVRQFGGRGQIVTLYAPFVCEACGAEVDRFIDLRKEHANLLGIARTNMTCDECGSPALFDDHPEDYFEVVANVPPPKLSSALASMLDDTVGNLKVVKELGKSITALWLSGTLDTVTRFKRMVDGLDGQVVVIFHDRVEITARGREALRVLTSAKDVEIAFARVPLALALELADAGALGVASVASTRVTLTCAECRRKTDFDLTCEGVTALLKDGRACWCGMPMTLPREELERGAGLPWALLREEVSDYLLERVEPNADRADDRLAAAETLPGSKNDGALPGSKSDGVLGRYELIEPIASGGMGVVFLARVRGIGGFERRVALKRIHPHLADTAEFVAMFLDEARLAAQIHHLNVVSTIDIQQSPLFLVMDYVEGCSAEEVIASAATSAVTPALPVGIAARIVLDMLAGLHAAHELVDENGRPLNLVHRDVSPPNLLIGVDGVSRVTDFGVALAERRLTRTEPGSLKGKLAYMSPEQLAGVEVDRRSDVYAAGVVAWELFAGRWLFGDDTTRGALHNVMAGAKQTPQSVNHRVPPKLGDVCMRALSQKPDDRFATAASFADAIEAACDECGVRIESARAVGAEIRPFVRVREPMRTTRSP